MLKVLCVLCRTELNVLCCAVLCRALQARLSGSFGYTHLACIASRIRLLVAMMYGFDVPHFI
jgi:hypothetical protein